MTQKITRFNINSPRLKIKCVYKPPIGTLDEAILSLEVNGKQVKQIAKDCRFVFTDYKYVYKLEYIEKYGFLTSPIYRQNPLEYRFWKKVKSTKDRKYFAKIVGYQKRGNWTCLVQHYIESTSKFPAGKIYDQFYYLIDKYQFSDLFIEDKNDMHNLLVSKKTKNLVVFDYAL